mmetsp:Transcript_10317/g.1543  ORF Transcript_10317/g.1543 Transcript_10317/m.1543 type:complete len:112 (+) Transcript_10317:2032-2367(+)
MIALLQKQVPFISPENLPGILVYIKDASSNVIESSTVKQALHCLLLLLQILIQNQADLNTAQQIILAANQASEILLKHPNLHTKSPDTTYDFILLAKIHAAITLYFKMSGS